jgi:hypothetical protein
VDVRLVGHGHEEVRATHDKTLEVTADPEITGRATCVIAVGATVDAAQRLAGPVRITIRAGDETFAFTARANSSWAPAGSAVIRRSDRRLPGTLATRAAAAASDLPRSLVAALRDPATPVELTFERIPGPPTAVLFALDPGVPGDPRLTAEFAAADVVVAEDDDAGRLLGERVAPGPVQVAGRVLVVACHEVPGRTVAAALGHVEVETVGLPPVLSAAAAGASRGPVFVAPSGTDPRDALRRAPAEARIVLTTSADRVAALLELGAELRGTEDAVIVEANAPPRRLAVGVGLSGRGTVHICFDGTTGNAALDPNVRSAVDGLLADGVATKAVARALAALTGWDRRRAYDAVLARSGRFGPSGRSERPGRSVGPAD